MYEKLHASPGLDTSDSESSPLYGDRQSVEKEEEEEYFEYPRRPAAGPRRCALFCHGVVLSFYSLLFVLAWWRLPVQRNCHDDLIFSPVREAVSYVRVPTNNNPEVKSIYKGKPNPELDAAWSRLVKNSNIKVTEETLRRLGRSSIKLQDGSGMYGAGIQVHHHLHCLKEARHMLYRDYYGIPNEPEQWAHLDHCLDDIRLSLMCQADFSLLTWDWLPNYRRPWANFSIDTECVDWEKLDGWAADNGFSLYDGKSVVHPVMGLSYPIGPDGEIDTDPRIRPHADELAALANGTNPKGNWGPDYIKEAIDQGDEKR